MLIGVPLASGLFTPTTRLTEPAAPAARIPMFQVTTPPANEPPFEAETKAAPTGTVSRISTPVAWSVPVFE